MSTAISNTIQASQDQAAKASDQAQRAATQASDQASKASGQALDKASKASEQASKDTKDLLNRTSTLASDATQSIKHSVGLDTSKTQTVKSDASSAVEQAKQTAKSVQDNVVDVASGAKAQAEGAVDGARATGNTLYEQAATLAANTVQYVKETAGLAQTKAAETKDRALDGVDKNVSGSPGQTFTGLLNQAREFTGEALGSVKNYVAAGQAKTQEAADGAGDKAKDVKDAASQAVDDAAQSSYVEQARNMAANAIGQAQNIVSTASTTTEEQVSKTKGQSTTTSDQVAGVVKDVKDIAANQTAKANTAVEDTVQSVGQGLANVKLQADEYAQAGQKEVGKATEEVRAKAAEREDGNKH